MRALLLLGLIGGPLGAVGAQAQLVAGQQLESFQAAPDALESVSWRTRTQVGNEGLTRWRFGIAAGDLANLTFYDAVVRAHAVRVNSIEGSGAQRLSARVQKNLGPDLTAAELEAVRGWLSDAGLRMRSYRVTGFAPDAAANRRLFEFARALNVETIVGPYNAASVAELDGLANEFEINVALAGPPETVMRGLDGRGGRLSVAAELGPWMEQGIAPLSGLAVVKDRLAYVSLSDRTALGPGGRSTMLGQGVGEITRFFEELDRLEIRPLVLSLSTAGVVNAPGELFAAVDAFEEVVQPVYGAFFTNWSLTRTFPIGELRPSETMAGEELSPRDVRRRIAAAILDVPYVEPRQPRKLLVIESLHGMYHNPGIPEANLMIDLMGKITGAWETEFSNDLNNLKWPTISQYDAVFVNSAVNEMFPDPEVREGLSRFVREGGGLGGVHGTPWASRNWEEFAVMIGSRSAPHRIEMGVMHVFDPASPIMKPFNNQPLLFREEYYRFEDEGYNRLRWEEVRVLLTVELDNPEIEPRPWNGYKRPDNVYPVTWVRTYGQGRVFYSSLGHLAETFMTPQIVGHFFAGIQFMLGDLDVDTTPNPLTAGSR